MIYFLFRCFSLYAASLSANTPFASVDLAYFADISLSQLSS
jgi:hypothetical protein